MELPFDVWKLILQLLPFHEQLTLTSTCTYLYQLRNSFKNIYIFRLNKQTLDLNLHINSIFGKSDCLLDEKNLSSDQLERMSLDEQKYLDSYGTIDDWYINIYTDQHQYWGDVRYNEAKLVIFSKRNLLNCDLIYTGLSRYIKALDTICLWNMDETDRDAIYLLRGKTKLMFFPIKFIGTSSSYLKYA